MRQWRSWNSEGSTVAALAEAAIAMEKMVRSSLILTRTTVALAMESRPPLEQAARALKMRRRNTNREFISLQYEKIRETIEQAVEKANAAARCTRRSGWTRSRDSLMDDHARRSGSKLQRSVSISMKH